MRRFSQMFEEVDATNRVQEKVAALERYFREAPGEDAAWALFFLTGNRLPSPVGSKPLRAWMAGLTGLPDWLVEECYARVGDLAETLALLHPGRSPGPAGRDQESEGLGPGLREVVEGWVMPLRGLEEGGKREMLLRAWEALGAGERLVFNKLITGAFRVGVQKALVVRALAAATGTEAAVLAHRLMGTWRPSPEDYRRLVDPAPGPQDAAQPYPFFLAHPLEERSTAKEGAKAAVDLGALLGRREDWQVEWKWDGIRAQLLRRAGQVVLWSRGEDLLTERFPEVVEAARRLPEGTALDGEILAWRAGRPLPFAALQQRIGRKHVSKKVLLAAPAAFLAYDLLEAGGKDVRGEPLRERRQRLEAVLGHREGVRTARAGGAAEAGPGRGRGGTRGGEQLELFGEGEGLGEAGADYGRRGGRAGETEPGGEAGAGEEVLQVSPVVGGESWEAVARLREESRERGVEGFMLKRLDSAYGVGRTKGMWWKWKIDPFTVDAVMLYAQPGHGRRAGLMTDFTFGVWSGPERGELVTLCKAYSGLTDAEFEEINRWIAGHATGREGPVRRVAPELVFEIAFEAIQRSERHKAGFALRFPRMARWRKDKRAEEADTMDTIRGLARE